MSKTFMTDITMGGTSKITMTGQYYAVQRSINNSGSVSFQVKTLNGNTCFQISDLGHIDIGDGGSGTATDLHLWRASPGVLNLFGGSGGKGGIQIEGAALPSPFLLMGA
jgi:hypothetical protein